MLSGKVFEGIKKRRKVHFGKWGADRSYCQFTEQQEGIKCQRQRKNGALLSKDKPQLPSLLLEAALFSSCLTPSCGGDEWLKRECQQSFSWENF